jgi:hypothetical protein
MFDYFSNTYQDYPNLIEICKGYDQYAAYDHVLLTFYWTEECFKQMLGKKIKIHFAFKKFGKMLYRQTSQKLHKNMAHALWMLHK